MSQVPGPIKIDIEILGAHDTEVVAKLMAQLSLTVQNMLGTEDFSVGLDYGHNN